MARRLRVVTDGANWGTVDGEALRRDVERVASLMREQASLGEDIQEICAAADEAGVCSKKELRHLARESLMDPDVLTAHLERMEMLRHALGQFEDTPLGAAAARRRSPEAEPEPPEVA